MKKEDYLSTIANSERRFNPGKLEVRESDSTEGKKKIITGYAAVFNRDSEDFGGWVERIDPKAFDEVLSDDVRALFNHDSNLILGRNGTTLKLSIDSVGLKYEIELPDTTAGRDLFESIKRGDVSQSSFGFIYKEHSWQSNKEKNLPSVRTILKVARLFDVSPVTFPAYPDTQVAARSFSQVNNEPEYQHDLVEIDRDFRTLELNKLKSK